MQTQLDDGVYWLTCHTLLFCSGTQQSLRNRYTCRLLETAFYWILNPYGVGSLPFVGFAVTCKICCSVFCSFFFVVNFLLFCFLMVLILWYYCMTLVFYSPGTEVLLISLSMLEEFIQESRVLNDCMPADSGNCKSMIFDLKKKKKKVIN